MLRLLACAPRDGWAFVNKDDDIVLVRPPYRQSSLYFVSEASVERAIHAHGFTQTELSFPNWDALVGFLRQQIVETHRALSSRIPTAESVTELLRRAPREAVVRYLDRIDSELLANGERGPAVALLTVLIGLQAVRDDSALLDRALQLLKRCSEQARELDGEEQLATEEDLARRFPNAVEEYGAAALSEHAGTISKRRRIWAFA